MPHLPAAPRKTPVQPRAHRTVQTIFDATAQVLADEGEQAFTTNRVAERAGYSIGTLYQYFPNKTSLLQGLVERERRRLMHGAQQRLRQAQARGDSPARCLRDHIGYTVDEFGRGGLAVKRPLVRLAWRIADEAAIARAYREMAEFFLQLMSRDDLRHPAARAPSRAQMLCLTWAVMGAVRSASLEQSPLLDDPGFKDELVRLCWGMLRGDGDPPDR